VAVLTLLSSCKEEKTGAAAAPAAFDPVRQAAEQNIRAGTPSSAQMTFRGMQVYPQAIPQRFAVCGQVDPFPDDSRMFVPFVTIVSVLDKAADGTAQYKFEQYIGTSTTEAGRVYLAIVNYCYDKGGPGNGPIRSVMPMAPLPVGIPDPAAKAPPPPAPTASAATPQAARSRCARAPTCIAIPMARQSAWRRRAPYCGSLPRRPAAGTRLATPPPGAGCMRACWKSIKPG
jgi:hypothetical protein